MSSVTAQDLTERSLGATVRRDAWWIQPLVTAIVLGAFGVYSTWAAWVGEHFEWGPYLSPFYSPLFQFDWWPLSPAFLILGAPLGFRVTCYYYRKAYYRSFWFSPPACAVRDGHATYTGETRFPLLVQNLHRYFFYVATLVVLFLWWDAILAFRFSAGGGGYEFGMGVGTLVLLANAALLSLYSFSCHSCRHLCGGGLNLLSEAPFRYKLWLKISRLNEHHMLYAWISLAGVMLADLYVRLLSMGYITDLRIF